MSEMILSPRVRAQVDEYAHAFANASPFRHVVIDDFLSSDAANSLLEQFPSVADPSKLMSEFGTPNPKSAISDVRSLGPAYVRMDQYVASREFLDFMIRLTGIPDLRYDPYYYGGGTHENFHGAGLDPHYDFNIHPKSGYHRRVNAIVYLNKDWRPEWGGQIRFHTDPWDVRNDEIKEVEAVFNRCAVFETTERSWHSVSTVSLPPDLRRLSRKSFTIYLYTETRPQEEMAPEHGTVYVQPGLPPHIKPGHVMTAADVEEINSNFDHRNWYLRTLYKREYAFSRHAEELKGHIAALRRSAYVPVLGYAKVTSVISPPFPDMFLGERLEFEMNVLRAASGVQVSLWGPDNLDPETVLTVSVGGTEVTQPASKGMQVIELRQPMVGPQTLRVTASKTSKPASSDDVRDLSLVLDRIELLHG